MESNIPRPPYDDELNKTLTSLKFPVIITPELIPALRAGATPGADEIVAGQPVAHEERSIKGPGRDITVSIFRSRTTNSIQRPAIICSTAAVSFPATASEAFLTSSLS